MKLVLRDLKLVLDQLIFLPILLNQVLKKAFKFEEKNTAMVRYLESLSKFEKDEKQRARCDYYAKDYAANNKIHGTSTLTSHLKRCKKYPYHSETQQIKQTYQQPITVTLQASKVWVVKTWILDFFKEIVLLTFKKDLAKSITSVMHERL
ncbi:hypothetical protein ACH5RR_016051 [Cinchona calisaya]|uniref:BED-type domain-containing protein n=1 Tax=Cinchona calisaya TaxID=153742 RepID=A0ABD2ZYI5_9GENT